jgi:O-antigen ligase
VLSCVRIALALAILLFVPGLREGFEPAKAAALRACGLSLLAAALVAGDWRRRAGVVALDVAVGLWLAIEIASTAFSAAPIVSLVGEPLQREGLLTSLALAGIYAGLRLTPGRPGLDRLAGWILVPAALASLYALAQAAGWDPIRWLDPATYLKAGVGLRPFGTLGHPNLMGAVAALCGTFALTRAAGERRHRIGFASAALLFAVVTLATLSRGAWMGFAAGALVGVPLALKAGSEPRSARQMLLAGAAFVLGVVVVAIASGWGARLALRARELLSPFAGSGSSRLEIWRSAWAAWQARPWLGHGPDTFDLVFPRFQTPNYWRTEWAGLVLHAHSIYLHTLATRGGFGILAGAGLLAALAATARGAWHGAPLSRTAVATSLSLIAAAAVAGTVGALGIAGALLVTVAGAGLANLAAAPAPEPARPLRGSARTAGIVIGIAATTFAIADLRGAAALRSAEDWLTLARSAGGEDRDLRQWALTAADRSARLCPWDDVAFRMQSEALLAGATVAESPAPALAAAEWAAHHALEMVPARAVNFEQLARVAAARAISGDPDAAAAAHRAVERMATLAPVNALLLVEGARLEQAIGHPEDARRLGQKVVALYPTDRVAYLVIAEASRALGDTLAAAEALRRAAAAPRPPLVAPTGGH